MGAKRVSAVQVEGTRGRDEEQVCRQPQAQAG